MAAESARHTGIFYVEVLVWPSLKSDRCNLPPHPHLPLPIPGQFHHPSPLQRKNSLSSAVVFSWRVSSSWELFSSALEKLEDRQLTKDVLVPISSANP